MWWVLVERAGPDVNGQDVLVASLGDVALLSVSVDSDDRQCDVEFWESVLGTPCTAVLTWAPGVGSAFFELADSVKLIVNAPSRTPRHGEWIGFELEIADPESTHARLLARGITVSDVYDTDGGSRAIVVTAPNGQTLRMGTRWALPAIDADLSGSAPTEQGLA